MKTTLTLMRYVLRSPEPEDTGSGSGGEGTEPPATEGGEAAPTEPTGDLWGAGEDEGAEGDESPANEPPDEPPAEDTYEVDWGGVEFADDAQRSQFEELGKKHGVPAAAYGGLMQELEAMMKAQQGAAAAAQDKATLGELKKAWGADFEAKTMQCKGAFKAFAKELGISPTELQAQLPSTPATMQLMQRFAELQGGNSLPVNSSHGNKIALNSQGLPTFTSDPSHPDFEDYHNPNSPRHAQLNSIVNRYCSA